MRIRADTFVSIPVNVRAAFGMGQNFDTTWRHFRSAMNDTLDAAVLLRAWFLTAATPFYIPIVANAEPPRMAHSPINTVQFNAPMLRFIRKFVADRPRLDVTNVNQMRSAVSIIALRQRILYISGGLFLHAGPARSMVQVTHAAFSKYREQSLAWSEQFRNDPVAGKYVLPIVPQLAAHIKLSQEQNIRLVHKYMGEIPLVRGFRCSVCLLRTP